MKQTSKRKIQKNSNSKRNSREMIYNSRVCGTKDYVTDFFYYTQVETDYAVKKKSE